MKLDSKGWIVSHYSNTTIFLGTFNSFFPSDCWLQLISTDSLSEEWSHIGNKQFINTQTVEKQILAKCKLVKHMNFGEIFCDT